MRKTVWTMQAIFQPGNMAIIIICFSPPVHLDMLGYKDNGHN